jgi:hypothetical protein
MFDSDIYFYFDNYSHIIVIWLYLFGFYTISKFVYRLGTNYNKFVHGNFKLIDYKENLIIEELPGLTFILLHTLCWIISDNLFTKIIFLYWGPLYLVTAYLVVFKKKINWKHIAIPSSYACKFFYVFFVLVFGYLQLYLPIYCYSLWIMHDQVKLAWLKNNADRTRRFFEDYFIFRIGYPLGLLLPFVMKDFYLRNISMSLSVGILVLWVGGIGRLVRAGIFFDKPKIEGFGRDIVYL